ncbi:hypothetical protein L2U69_12300 [Zavarzinia compransoris]|uniref:hypothetical protein n=1 Tax=Zavarzinia marina TaxID=2911065 RepID=UPI001F1616D1|nr:hypothetical protein [Zavarzinia marina]MCF4166426.1 hypothetical protein [Zavarzinia marina]
MRTIDMMWWTWVLVVGCLTLMGVAEAVTTAASRPAPVSWEAPAHAPLMTIDPWLYAAITA